MSSLRIVVKIPTGTYPELISELDNVASRERAERLRVLAMIGLRELQRGMSASGKEILQVPLPQQNKELTTKASAQKLIQRLTLDI
jgi:hypothetical protein